MVAALGFLGLSLNDRTILVLVIFLDNTVSVGEDRLCIRTLALALRPRWRRERERERERREGDRDGERKINGVP